MRKYFYLLAVGLRWYLSGGRRSKKGDVLLGGTLGFSKQDASPVIPNDGKGTFYHREPFFWKGVRDNLNSGGQFWLTSIRKQRRWTALIPYYTEV